MMRINKVKSPTWNFLKINDTCYDEKITLNGSGRAVVEKIPAGVIIGNESCEGCNGCDIADTGSVRAVKCGMGEEADAFFLKASKESLMIRAKAGRRITEPVNIRYIMENGDSNADRVEIIAEEGSELIVIMDYSSIKYSAGGFLGIQTRIHLAKGARLHLVKVNLLGTGFTCMDDIGAVAEDDAGFELTKLELGSGKCYTGVMVDLKGRKSSFKGDVGYLCLEDKLLDMNYHISHHGRKTVSDLQVKGALRDDSQKTFKGVIDLIHGGKQASGNELEDVLLLSDNVVNKTLPVILCDEDDVEGAHGATIGRLSSDMKFYMQTRGFTEHEAELTVTKAKLNSVRNLIPDDNIHGRIQYFMEEAFKE